MKTTVHTYVKRVSESFSLRKRLEAIYILEQAHRKDNSSGDQKNDLWSKKGDKRITKKTVSEALHKSVAASTLGLTIGSPSKSKSNSSSNYSKEQSATNKTTSLSTTFISIPPPSPPVWAKWRDVTEYETTADSLSLAESQLQRILEYEMAISSEIRALANEGIFPSFELTLIKKDMKSFRELQEAMENDGTHHHTKDELVLDEKLPSVVELRDLEIKLSERKLTLLHTRRQDELEARALYQKKLARAKAAEDSQSKDPLNFRNQTGFNRF